MANLPAPERVKRFREVVAAPTRMAVLRLLMKETLTYPELFDRLSEDVMSRGAVYEALRELKRVGYVQDDAPDDVVRRRKLTHFWADRELVGEDMGAFFVYFLV
jgi:DNA-binding transcriptional ArsR family regulator